MARLQMHGVRPCEALDRTALAAAFVLGAGGSVLLKLTDAPILLTALYPVAVLLAYVVACFASRTASIEPETVGDNCYYLGFLFTLSSLAVTLYRINDLSAEAVNASDVIPQVVSGFGVALTSTVTGVFLRVMLMQMRPDIVARDREARRDLSQGARDFHLAMVQATRRLKEITIESAQHVAERNARLDELTDQHTTRTRELLEGQAKAFETAIAELGASLAREVATRLSGEAARSADALKLAADRLVQGQKGVEEALSGWRTSLEAQRLASTEASARLAEEARTLDGAVASRSADLKDASQRLADTAGLMATAVEGAVRSVEEAARRIEGVRSQEGTGRGTSRLIGLWRSLLDRARGATP